jgi:cupin superfamily acireductone dioxygenase involved in methionine salvage
MPRAKSIERMTARELAEMEVRVKRARIIKENHHKDMLRSAITKLAKENGFDVKDILR